MAVGPVFFTIAILALSVSVSAASVCVFVCAPASGQLFVRAGRVPGGPGGAWGWLYGSPSAWPRARGARAREPALSTLRLQSNDFTPNRVLAYASEASSSCGCFCPKLRCVFLQAALRRTRSNHHRCALQKTPTSSAAARCDFLQSSSRQHMPCMQSHHQAGGTASSATARRRTPSWAL